MIQGDWTTIQSWQTQACPFPLCSQVVRFGTWVTRAQLWSCTCVFAFVYLCVHFPESGSLTAHRSMCQTSWCVATISNSRTMADFGFISVLTALFCLAGSGRFQDRTVHITLSPEELLYAALIQRSLQLQTPPCFTLTLPCAHVYILIFFIFLFLEKQDTDTTQKAKIVHEANNFHFRIFFFKGVEIIKGDYFKHILTRI